MLALKVIYDKINMKKMPWQQNNNFLDTVKLLRCILKYQNRLKTILIFVKVANLVRKKITPII
jgi:hypothetical protein